MAIGRKKLEAHQLPAELKWGFSMSSSEEIRISPATVGIKDDEKPLEKTTNIYPKNHPNVGKNRWAGLVYDLSSFTCC